MRKKMEIKSVMVKYDCPKCEKEMNNGLGHVLHICEICDLWFYASPPFQIVLNDSIITENSIEKCYKKFKLRAFE